MILSLVLYVVSFFLPSLEFAKSTQGNQTPVYEVWKGFECFGMGMLGVATLTNMTALSNFLYIISMVSIYLKRHALALSSAILGAVLAGTIFNIIGKDFPGDSGGVTILTLHQMLYGSYVWLLSFILLTYTTYCIVSEK